MKRYKIVTDTPILNSLIGMSYEILEHTSGEWVKWEDHKEEFFQFTEIYEDRIRELKDGIERLKTVATTREDGVISIKDVTECNCKEKYMGTDLGVTNLGERRIMTPNSWICPKHGYKKR